MYNLFLKVVHGRLCPTTDTRTKTSKDTSRTELQLYNSLSSHGTFDVKEMSALSMSNFAQRPCLL